MFTFIFDRNWGGQAARLLSPSTFRRTAATSTFSNNAMKIAYIANINLHWHQSTSCLRPSPTKNNTESPLPKRPATGPRPCTLRAQVPGFSRRPRRRPRTTPGGAWRAPDPRAGGSSSSARGGGAAPGGAGNGGGRGAGVKGVGKMRGPGLASPGVDVVDVVIKLC